MEYILSIMETIRLKHFKTIVDAGGLLKASEILGISGGGLSKSIKSLEDELGYRLFKQKGRGLDLTEMGQEFYKRLPNALAALENLIEIKSQAKQESLSVSFASFEVFTTYFLAGFVAEFLPEHQVEIREATPGRMEQLVADGTCDLALTYEPIPVKGVEFLKVSKIKMGIFISAKLALTKPKVEGLPFAVPISPLQGAPSGVRGLDGWPEHLFERRVQYRVEMMETAIQLAHRGIAAAFLPDFIADAFNSQGLTPLNQIVEIKLPSRMKPIVRDVFIILKKGAEETALSKKLAKALRKISV